MSATNRTREEVFEILASNESMKALSMRMRMPEHTIQAIQQGRTDTQYYQEYVAKHGKRPTNKRNIPWETFVAVLQDPCCNSDADFEYRLPTGAAHQMRIGTRYPDLHKQYVAEYGAPGPYKRYQQRPTAQKTGEHARDILASDLNATQAARTFHCSTPYVQRVRSGQVFPEVYTAYHGHPPVDLSSKNPVDLTGVPESERVKVTFLCEGKKETYQVPRRYLQDKVRGEA